VNILQRRNSSASSFCLKSVSLEVQTS
jgi:hypothetical protein